jgi:hypothetical protein
MNVVVWDSWWLLLEVSTLYSRVSREAELELPLGSLSACRNDDVVDEDMT